MLNSAELNRIAVPDPYIETSSGKKFYINHPEFDVDDMAFALSNQCRYTGHVQFYSVAEHSILVASIMKLLKLGDPLEGLLHDGAESYLSDIASPWKAMLPDYKKLEAMIEVPMRKYFELPATITDGCKRADWLALLIEAHDLIPSKGANWPAPDGIKEEAMEIRDWFTIECLAPGEAYKYFMKNFETYAKVQK